VMVVVLWVLSIGGALGLRARTALSKSARTGMGARDTDRRLLAEYRAEELS